MTVTRRLATLAVLLVVAIATLGLAAGGAGAAKGKKKSANVFEQAATVNLPVPQDAATGPSVPIRPTLTVGKKFKGKVVGDVDVTIAATGAGGANSVDDLVYRLSSPSGRSILLVNGLGDTAIGPLTFDDDVPQSICFGLPGLCTHPQFSVFEPYVNARANLAFIGNGGVGRLSIFDGQPMRGVWTLTVWDDEDPAKTGTLTSWGLKITAAKPVRG